MQKRAVEKREKIISIAISLFAEFGFEETTTNMIAGEAGISVGSIYTHFKDKWEIFLLILEQHQERVYNYACENMDTIKVEKQDLSGAIGWIIPGLYAINKLNGKLNYELAKFILIDKRAAGISAVWEKKEDELIEGFLAQYKDILMVNNISAAAALINIQLRGVFTWLFENRGSVNEEEILGEFVNMLTNSIVSGE
ncbi:MAG: TetR/AcrR family transcriptional regulator [bacterium]|nr:TetR/AcrR family transcriptional regulator [bacterium]